VIPAIVLAAGKSTRMGRPKPLLPLASGDSFLAHIVKTLRAADVEDVVVVLGHEAALVERAFEHSPIAARFVTNAGYEAGQLSSLITALRVVDRPGVVAVLMTPVDVPLFSAATVRALVQRYRRSPAPVVRPVAQGRHGHPVLIDRRLFAGLIAADPGQGPRAVIRAHAASDADVEVDDPGAFLDIDTPEEYQRLLSPPPKSQ